MRIGHKQAAILRGMLEIGAPCRASQVGANFEAMWRLRQRGLVQEVSPLQRWQITEAGEAAVTDATVLQGAREALGSANKKGRAQSDCGGP